MLNFSYLVPYSSGGFIHEKKQAESYQSCLIISYLHLPCFPIYAKSACLYRWNGLGDLVFNERREIAQGVFLDTWLGKTPSGTPKRGHTISFNPKTSDAQVLTFYGDTVSGRATLSRMIADAEAQGYMVIGGINGDFYNLNNGVPIGLMIKDGRLISNNATKWGAIGFKSDGSVVIGVPGIEVKAILDETEFDIANSTRPRETGVLICTLRILDQQRGAPNPVWKWLWISVWERRSLGI